MRTKTMVGGLTAAMLALVGVVGVGLATADDDEPTRPADSISMTSEDDRYDDTRDDSAPAQQTAVSADQAVEIAKQQVTDGRVTEVESEQEHGRLVWSVELDAAGTHHEVYVDATTGEVVEHETENADDTDDSDHDSDPEDDDHGDDHDGS